MPVQYPKAKPKTKLPPAAGRSSSRLPSTRVLLIGAGLLAAVIAAALIGFSLSSSGSKKSSGGATPPSFLNGLPQEGQVLGRRNAPVTLIEYGDLQCPFCAQFDLGAVPTLASEYVASGKLQIVFRPIVFVGQQSEVGVRATLAAGLQNRLWQMAELLYAQQGGENVGWLSSALVRTVARGIPGLDAGRLERDLGSARVTQLGRDAATQARQANLNGTPFFQIGRSKGPLTVLTVTSLDASAFRPAIDRLLGR